MTKSNPPKSPSPSSSGEHEAVKRLKDSIAQGLDLADRIKEGSELPKSISSNPPAEEEQGPDTLRRPDLKPRTELVLVVDDDFAIRDGLAGILRHEGYRVLTAGDGIRALEKIVDSPSPDIIILDMGLPRLSGRGVLGAMQGEGITIPVLVISAGDEQRLRRESPELAEKFLFTKPFKLEAFLRKVAELVAERRLQAG